MATTSNNTKYFYIHSYTHNRKEIDFRETDTSNGRVIGTNCWYFWAGWGRTLTRHKTFNIDMWQELIIIAYISHAYSFLKSFLHNDILYNYLLIKKYWGSFLRQNNIDFIQRFYFNYAKYDIMPYGLFLYFKELLG